VKRLCLLLAAVLALTMGGCALEPVTSEPTSSDSAAPSAPGGESLRAFAIAYSREDTLNPFATKAEVNWQLAPLLYDSLTAMNESFQARHSLASAVTFTDSTHITTTLRKGAKFSDGSAVTAADVAASFRLAKASANYQELLSNVTAAVANNKARTVTFTLAAPDPHAEACLSFPVVKVSTLTTAAGKAPVGGGLYKLTKEGESALLTVNPHSGSQPKFREIELRHLPNTNTMYYGLTSGDISYYFNDLSGGTIPRMTGASVQVPMNALVYMGINSSREALAKPAVRQALSALLDRSVLAGSAYSGWATASALPFHPAWKPVTELAITAPKRDLEGALATLKEAGYTEKKAGLKFTLIYPTGNKARAAAAEQIRTQMEGAGITVILTPLKYATYMSRLKTGDYDLYLGEVRLAANMSLRPLLAGGKAGYGVKAGGETARAYEAYLTGESTLEAFLTTFEQDMPFIPLCWRSGFAAYDRRLSSVTPGPYNAFYGFAQWQ